MWNDVGIHSLAKIIQRSYNNSTSVRKEKSSVCRVCTLDVGRKSVRLRPHYLKKGKKHWRHKALALDSRVGLICEKVLKNTFLPHRVRSTGDASLSKIRAQLHHMLWRHAWGKVPAMAAAAGRLHQRPSTWLCDVTVYPTIVSAPEHQASFP